MRKYFFFILSICTLLFISSNSFAQDSVDDLKAEVQQLKKRVAELEASQQANIPPQPDPFFHQGRSHWDPFEEMRRMQEEMDRMFQGSFFRRGNAPAMGMFNSDVFYDADFDIKEEESQYVVEVDITGLDKDKIEIDINPTSITVSGQTSQTTEEEQTQAYFQSRSFASFVKTIPLPADANTDQVATEKKDNKIIITIPRRT